MTKYNTGGAVTQDAAIQNALTSIRMEGLQVTAEMVELCRKALSGELTLDECFDRLLSVR